ncbi:hypothetical protein IQ07DRAFT_583516 [Pyrenochaeta sp. DS3sAY3a]|nr:hypothetical protein IQ07DRAFT_583516 [Pyrenochaeta sp. DS3sAY3a]
MLPTRLEVVHFLPSATFLTGGSTACSYLSPNVQFLLEKGMAQAIPSSRGPRQVSLTTSTAQLWGTFIEKAPALTNDTTSDVFMSHALKEDLSTINLKRIHYVYKHNRGVFVDVYILRKGYADRPSRIVNEYLEKTYPIEAFLQTNFEDTDDCRKMVETVKRRAADLEREESQSSGWTANWVSLLCACIRL